MTVALVSELQPKGQVIWTDESRTEIIDLWVWVPFDRTLKFQTWLKGRELGYADMTKTTNLPGYRTYVLKGTPSQLESAFNRLQELNVCIREEWIPNNEWDTVE
jgi:seryl-tRNA synthetase